MPIKNKKDVPKKITSQSLVEYTEVLTDWYIDETSPEYRKKKGQFFTPKIISELMVRQFNDINKKEEIRILDPGAGIGIFESAFCEFILSFDYKVKLSFFLYENDPDILFLLRKNLMTCKKVMADEGFEIVYKIINKDFILSNASFFNVGGEKTNNNKNGYDLVISNPPYYKLNKDSPQSIKMKSIMNGQPNIYPLFMALSAKLLKNNGQITILTPRSYCSGLYFNKFRKYFFDIVKPLKIHIFESRKEVFKKYNVLQENIILTAIKTLKTPKRILISTSNGKHNGDEKINIRRTTYDKVIFEKGDDVFVRIPTSKLDELIAMHLDRFNNNLKRFGIKVSTGPVVPFRAKDYLLKNIYDGKDSVPLIWMYNIVNGMIKWPIEKDNKPTAIRKTKESEKILIQNKMYVLVKRFSTKEGKQRINAGILLNNLFDSDLIGIENHVNYIYKKEGELTINEAYGIVVLLNSRLYNQYFQMTNGNTQVNATEIMNIPLPSIEEIRKIGSLAGKVDENNGIRNEQIIANEMNIDEEITINLIGKR